MARIDGKLTAAGEASIEMADLIRLLANSRLRADGERQLAMACYLSASEGWRNAGHALRGAFANAAIVQALTEKKQG